MTPEARDAQAREAAQKVFDRPLIVEAGAGTGKTTILVARVLSWVLGPGWDEARREVREHEAAKEHKRSGKKPDTHAIEENLAAETIAARALEGVAAITFTEAAAAEMAARVAQRLAEVATGELSAPGFDPALVVDRETERVPAETLTRRARALLGQLDRLTATTIHAFCHALLRRHPLEARLHPDFAIDARGERTEEIVRSVVETRVKQAYAEDEVGDSPILELAALGKSPQQVAEALTYFAFEGTPASGFATDPFHADVLGPIVDEVKNHVASFLEIAAGDLARIKRTTNPARVQRALEATGEALEGVRVDPNNGLSIAQDLCSTLSRVWDGPAWAHFKKWGRGNFAKTEGAALGDRKEPLTGLAAVLVQRIAYLRKADPRLLDTARRALQPLLEEVEREARASGVVTFQALLREAWKLLNDHRRILERERRGIRQLLVDEFQDTDRLQCDIVELLALPGAKSEQRVGLFIVGDPKQSIYGWRNADLEAYDRLVGLALEAGGERYPLVRNFRSRPEILAEVERAIEPVMVPEKGLQPPFESLVASADCDAPPEGPDSRWAEIEYWVSWHPDWRAKTKQAEAAEIEARSIAQDIRLLHDHGVAWKDCALLMRNASRVDTYLDGFRDAGVPFVVTSDKQYFRRREVIDASALIRAVVTPADHVALLTWMRSPLVGVPDAALIPLWSREFPRLMTELTASGGADQTEALARLEAAVDETAALLDAAPGAELPGLDRIKGWDKLLVHSIRTLADLRAAFHNETADRFLERLRWAFLPEAIEGARYLGRYRIANLERLFRTIQQGLESRGGDVQAVLRILRRSVSLALDAEEALPKDAAEDAVQVMTIHKAKGLEFHHVYLAQLHAEGRSSERSAFDADRRWDTLQQLEYVLFDSPTLGFDAVERHRERVSAAEQVRTLYVALTRAQKRLVLVGNWPEEAKKGRSGQPTYVGLLSERREHPESIAKLAPAASVLEEGVVDAAGVRWKFPGLTAGEAEPAPRPLEAGLPSAQEAKKASITLHEQREEARKRMERPFLARASMGKDIEGPTPDSTDQPAYSRQTALAIGKVVHHALENWDLTAELEAEHEGRLEHARRYFEELAPGDEFTAGWSEVVTLLERLRDGQLLGRLLGDPEAVLARELPILAPPASDADRPAVAGVSGTVDLVLRGNDGAWTVVDYKTDRVESEDEIRSRAELYAPQLETYARALASGFGLDQTPKSELWFVWPDRLWPTA